MADDMTNGHNFDAQARYAALDERVTNLRTSLVNLEGEVRSGFSGINSHLTSLSNELRTSTKTQWPVIWAAAGVAFSVIVGVGWMAYTPIQRAQDDLDADIKDVRGAYMPRAEVDALAERAREERGRIWEILDRIETDRKSEVGRLDRRIDEVRGAFEDIYGLRDLIMDLKARDERPRRRTRFPQ